MIFLMESGCETKHEMTYRHWRRGRRMKRWTPLIPSITQTRPVWKWHNIRPQVNHTPGLIGDASPRQVALGILCGKYQAAILECLLLGRSCSLKACYCENRSWAEMDCLTRVYIGPNMIPRCSSVPVFPGLRVLGLRGQIAV